MSDRFDLEENIMKCWLVVDDLNFLLKHIDDWNEEERSYYINGLMVKYESQFQDTFDVFSELVREKQFVSMSGSSIHAVHLDEFDELNDGYST